MNYRPLAAVAIAILALLFSAQCSDDTADTANGPAGQAAGDPDPATAPPPDPVEDAPPELPIPDDVPRIRLALTGNMAGQLEPCGCASAQLGGLPRRRFFLRQDGQFDLRIEGGNLIADANPLSNLKLYTALEILYSLPDPSWTYDVQGIGPIDLSAPDDEFAVLTSVLSVPLVSADLQRTLPEDESMPWQAEPFREFEIKGVQVRVSGLTLAVPPGVDGYTVQPPHEAWTAAMEGAAPATLRILMVHGSAATTREFASTLDPKPDLLIGINNEYAEPPIRPERIDGVPVVFPGAEGRSVLEVTLARLDDGPRLGYHVNQLAGSKTAPKAMQDQDVINLLLQHRHDAAGQGMLETMAEREPTANGHTYVGSESCKECHAADYEIWSRSRHAMAWQTLENVANSDRYPWPTTQYPDCVACHTVGYGEESGFVNPERTPLLVSVGCEECHGPASAHVADPKVVMGTVGSQKCTECHDHDQSPDFEYGVEWLRIRHGDK